MLTEDPSKTIGVVTFNIQQPQTVLYRIDDRVASDETFAKLWEEATSSDVLDPRRFVKNLQGVQGDDRDIIIFSLGQAPVAGQAE